MALPAEIRLIARTIATLDFSDPVEPNNGSDECALCGASRTFIAENFARALATTPGFDRRTFMREATR